MANLTCSATNCGHNTQGECFAGSINVFGASANTTSNTICASFIDEASSSFTNCANCTCTKTNDINCRAQNCVHNDYGSCKASGVQINSSNASCETFKSR